MIARRMDKTRGKLIARAPGQVSAAHRTRRSVARLLCGACACVGCCVCASSDERNLEFSHSLAAASVYGLRVRVHVACQHAVTEPACTLRTSVHVLSPLGDARDSMYDGKAIWAKSETK